MSITTDTVSKTIAGARITGQGNDLVLDTSSFYKPTQTGAYPIVEATYEIVCSKYPDAATGTAVRALCRPQLARAKLDWTNTDPFRCRNRSKPDWRPR